MPRNASLLGAIGLAGLAVVAGAQVGARKQSDDRVEQLLEEAELNYTIDADGDFRLVNRFDSGRTQVVFVESRTSRLGTLEIRRVWSVGFQSDPMSEDEMLALLEQNRIVKLGAWQVARVNGRSTAVFSAQVAADTDELSLLLALQAVSETADEMEEEVTGADDL